VPLLALLRGPIQPAKLIFILAAINADAFTLESTEDIINAIILLKVALLLAKGGFLGGNIGGNGLEGFPRSGDETRLASAGGIVGKNAVLNQPDAQSIQLAVDIVAKESRKIRFEVVN
jgi:hypothetical protein